MQPSTVRERPVRGATCTGHECVVYVPAAVRPGATDGARVVLGDAVPFAVHRRAMARELETGGRRGAVRHGWRVPLQGVCPSSRPHSCAGNTRARAAPWHRASPVANRYQPVRDRPARHSPLRVTGTTRRVSKTPQDVGDAEQHERAGCSHRQGQRIPGRAQQAERHGEQSGAHGAQHTHRHVQSEPGEATSEWPDPRAERRCETDADPTVDVAHDPEVAKTLPRHGRVRAPGHGVRDDVVTWMPAGA